MVENLTRFVRTKGVAMGVLFFFLHSSIVPTSLDADIDAMLSGAQIEAGQVSFNRLDASTLEVSASDRAIINFDAFSIAANEVVRFIQPLESSSVLARVVGNSASDIFGALFANGEFVLINTNGIHFAETANINVGSLIASTLDIQNAVYQAGQYVFEKGEGSAFGQIFNEANIGVTDGGHIVMLGESIRNTGTLTANLGSVVLGLGEKQTLSFDENGLINLVIDRGLVDVLEGQQKMILNEGEINAAGGKVVMTVQMLNDTFDILINNTGIIQANEAVMGEDGVIELRASGSIHNTGTLETDSGSIEIEAAGDVESFGVLRAAYLDEFGAAFRVGGEYHVGSATVENLDDAITLNTGNYSGLTADAADIVVNNNAVITLTGDTTFDADSDDNSTGGFSMNIGSSIVGGGYNLTIYSSNSGIQQQLRAISGVGTLTFNRSAGGMPIYYANAGISATNLTLNSTTQLYMNNHSLTVSGTFSNNALLNLYGGETLSGFTNDTDSGTVLYSGNAGNLTQLVGGNNYYNLSFSRGTFEPNGTVDVNGTLYIDPTAVFDLDGQNLDLTGGSFSNDGTLMLQGGETLTNFTNDTDSGMVLYDGTGTYTGLNAGDNYYGLRFVNSGSWTLDAALDVNSHLWFQASATLDVSGSNHQVNVGGNWVNNSGTFNERNGTVVFDGTGELHNSETFYNLTKSGSTTSGVSQYGPHNLTVTNNFTISAGTFDLNGQALTLTGASFSNDGILRLYGSETLTGFTNDTNSGTVYYDGNSNTTQLVAGNNYYNLTFNANGSVWEPNGAVDVNGTLTILAGIFDLDGQNLDLTGGSFSNDGTLRLLGSETLTGFTNDTNSGTVWYDGSGSYTGLAAGDNYYGLTFTGAGSWALDAALDVNAGLNISSGTLDVSTDDHQINVAGDWSRSGTFNAQNGTVVLDGGNQTISSSTTFYNLSKTETTNNSTDTTLTFTAGITTTVDGLLTLNGLDGDDRINLRSSSAGVYWFLNANGTFAVDYVDVQDSDATGGLKIVHTDTISNGNNFNWFGQSYKWLGGASGAETDFNTGANWDLGSAPGAGDEAWIPDTANDPILDAAASLYGLKISSGAIIDLASYDLTLGVGVFNNEGTLRLYGGQTVTGVTNDANSGTVQYQGGSGTYNGLAFGDTYYNLAFNDADSIWVLDAALDVDMDLTISAGTLDVNGVGNYQINAGGNWNATGGTFTARNGTVVFDIDTGFSTNSVTDGGSNWYNLTFDGGYIDFADSTVITNDVTLVNGGITTSSSMTVNGGDFTGYGVVTFGGGTFTLNGTGDFGGDYSTWTFNNLVLGNGVSSATTTKTGGVGITVGVDFTLSANHTLDAGDDTWTVGGNFANNGTFTANTSTFNFNSSGTQTLNANGDDFYNITHSGNGTLQLISNPLTVTNDFTNHNSGGGGQGVFDLNGQDWVMTGAAFSNEGTVLLGGTEVITGLTMDTNSGFFEYDGSGNYTGLAAGDSYYSLTISGSGTYILDAPLDVNGTVWISNGVLDVDSGDNHQINVGGGWSNAASAFLGRTGKVVFDGTGTIGTNSGFNDVEISTAGTVTLGDALDVNDDLVFGGGILDASVGNHSIYIGGDWSDAIDVGDNFTEGSGTVVFDGTGTITASGGSFAHVSINTAGTVTLGSAIDVNGNLGITAGAFDVSASDHQINLAGSWTDSGAGTFVERGGTVVFDGSSQTISANEAFNHIEMNSSGQVYLGANLDVNGNLTLTAGNLDVDVNNIFQINVGGNWTDTGSATFTPRGGTVVFDGDAGTINANDSFGGININNAGTTTVAAAMDVNGSVTLTAGAFDIGAQLNVAGGWTDTGAGARGGAGAGTIVFDGTEVINSNSGLGSIEITGSVTLGQNLSAGSLAISGYLNPEYSCGPSCTDYYQITTGAWSDGSGDNFNHGLGMVVFDGGGGTLSSDELFYNLQFASGTMTLGSTLDVNGNISFTDGVLASNGFQTNVAGNWTDTGAGGYSGNNLVVFDGTSTVNSNSAFYDLQIAGTGNVTLGGNIDVDRSLTISTSGLLDVSASDYSINVGGDWSNSGTFNAQEGLVTLDTGGANYTITNGNFFDLAINRSSNSTILGSALTVSDDLTLSDTGLLDVTWQNFQINIGGDWTDQGAGGYTGSGLVVFGGTGTIISDTAFHNLEVNSAGTVTLGAALDVNNNLTLTAGTFDVSASNYQINVGASWSDGGAGDFNERAGLVVFDGTGTLASNEAFNDVEINTAGTVTLGSALDVNDDLIVTAGTLDAEATNNYQINVGGDWTDTGAGTFTEQLGKVVFDGTGTINSNESFYDVEVNSAGVVTMGTTLDVTNALSITAGVLYMNGSYITTTNNFSNEGTLRLQGSETVSWAANDTDSGTWEYIGNGDAAPDEFNIRDFGANDYYHLKINATDPVDSFVLTDAVDIAGNLTINSGILYLAGYDVTTTTIFRNDGTLRLQGVENISWTTNDTDSGIFEYMGAGPIHHFTGADYYNLVLNSTGVTFTLAEALDVNGSLTLSAGTLDVGGLNRQINVGGDWTDTGTGTFTEGSGLVVFDGAGTINSNEAFNDVTIAGTMTLGAVLDVNDDLTISSGSLDVSGSNHQVNVGGDWTDTGAGTFVERAGLVVFDGTGAINANEAFNDVQINSGGTVTLGAALVVGDDLTLTSGVLDVSGSNYQITVGGDWTDTGAGNFTEGDALVLFNGTGTINSNEEFNDLTIAGTVTLGAALTANDDLTISSGSLDVSGSNYQINVGGDWTDTGAGTFVEQAGTVVFDGTGVINANEAFNSVEIAGGTSTLGNALDVNGNFTLTTGVFDQSTYTMNVEDNFSMANGTTFTKSSNSLALTFDGAGILTDSNGTKQDLGNVVIGGTTVTRTVMSDVKMTNLTIDSGNTFMLTGGNFDFSAAAAVVNNGTFRLRGSETLTNVNNLDINSGTVEYKFAGGSVTVKDFGGGADYYNLIINNSGQTSSLGTNIDLDGSFTLSSGTFNQGGHTMDVAGDFSIADGSTFTRSTSWLAFDGSGTITDASTVLQDLGHVIISNSSTRTLGDDVKMTSLTIDSGSTFYLANNDFSFVGAAAVANNGTFQLIGYETLTNVTNLDTNSGTVRYVTAGSNYTLQDFGGGADYYNLSINNAMGIASLGADVHINGTFDIGSGAFDQSTYAMNVAGDFSIANGATFTKSSNDSVLDFVGSGTITDNTASGQDLGIVAIDTATRTLASDVKMTGLTINSGSVFSLAGNDFSFSSAAAVSNNSGTFRLRGSETLTNVTNLDINSGTVEYTGATGAVAVKDFGATDYYDLRINNSGQTTSLGANLLVADDFVLNAGTFDQSTRTMNVAHDFSIANGATFTKSSNSSLLTFDGTGTLTDSNATKQDLGAVRNSASMTRTLGAGTKMTSLVNDGTFVLDGNNFEFSSANSVENSGIFRLIGSETLANVNSLDTNSGTVEYVGSGSYTGLIGGDNYYNLTFTTGGGTYTLDAALTVSNDIVIDSNATLDVSASNYQINVGGDWTNTGSTFTARNGTVVFNGSGGQVLSSGGDSFYNLTYSSMNELTLQEAVTVTNQLSIGLGSIISLNGQNLTMTGATFSNDGGLRLQGDEVITGFTNDTNSGDVYYVGTGSYTGLAAGDNYFSLSFNGIGGSWALDAALDVNSGFAITNGTFDQSNYTMNVAGEFNINAGASFTKSSNSSALTFDGTGTLADINGTLQDLGNVVIGGTTTTRTLGYDVKMTGLTINSGNTFSLAGYNFEFSGAAAVSNEGTFQLRGSETLTNVNNLDINSGTVEYNGASAYGTLAAGYDYYHLTFNNVAGSWQLLGGTLDVNGNISISAGTVEVFTPNQTINLAGNWSNSGTFIHNDQSTVVFDGGNQSITGSTTFYNLTKQNSTNNSTDDTLTFAAGSTTTIDGLLTLDGLDTDDRINLRSSTPGTHWDLVANGTFAVDYVDVKDSDASGGLLITHSNTISSGHNLNWGLNNTLTWVGGFAGLETDFGTAGNWDLGIAPTSDDYVIIADVANDPIFGANFEFIDLTINSGGVLDLGGYNLTLTGTYSNSGTLRLEGDETLTGFTNDTNSGTTVYYGTGNYSSGLVAGDAYYHLTFGGAGTWVLDANLDINGNLAVNAGTFDVANGSNYQINLAGNWSNGGGTFQERQGTVVFDGTSVLNNAETFHHVQIGSGTTGGSLDLGANMDVNGNLTVANGGATTFDIGFDSVFFAGNVNFTNLDTFTSTSSTVNFDGTSNLTSNGKTFFNINVGTGSASGSLTLLDSLDMDGTLAFNSTGGTAAMDIINQTLYYSAGGLNLTDADTFTTTGSTVVFDGATTLTSDGIGFNHIQLGSGSAGGTLQLGDSLDVNGNFTVANGGATNLIISSYTMYLAGNLNFTNLDSYTDNGTTALVFDGSGTSTLTSAGYTLAAMTVNGTAKTVQLADGLIVDALTIGSDDAFDINGSNFSFSVGSAVDNSGTFKLRGSETIGSVSSFDTNSGTVEYTGATGSVTIKDFGATDYYNLVINNSGQTSSLGGALDVDGSLTLSSGALDVSAFNYQINVGGNWTDTGAGTFTEGSGTVVFDGTGTINANEAFNDLTISSGTITLGAALDINDDFALSSGSLDVSASNYQINIGGDWADIGGGLGIFTARAGTVVFDGTGNVASHVAFNDLTIAGTTTLSNTLDVDDDLTISSGSLSVSGANYQINVGGDWTDTGAGTFTEGFGTVVFDGTGTINANESFYSVTIAGNSTLGATLNLIDSLTLSSGDLDVSAFNYQITIGNDWIDTGAGTFNERSGTVVFSGPTSIDSNEAFNNVTISGSTSLVSSLDVNGALSIGSGYTLDLEGQNLDITGGSFSNDGTLRMAGSETLTSFTNDTNSGTVEYDGTGSYLTALAGGNNYYNLTFSGVGGVWEPNSAVDVNGTLTVATGATFDLDGQNLDNTGGTFSNDGTLRMQGGETVTGFTNDTNSGTVQYDGTGSYLTALGGGNSYYNLLFSGNGGVWEPNGAVDVNGALTVSTGATFDLDGQNLDNTGGTFSNDGTLRMQGGETVTGFTNDTNSGTVQYDGTGSYLTALGGGNSYYNLLFSGNGGTWEPNGAVDVNGTLTVATGATFDLDGQNLDNTGGTFSNDGTVRMQGGETLTNFTNDTNSGTISYDGTGSYLTSLIAGNNYYNLSFVGNGGTWEPNGAVDVNGVLTVATGATFDLDGQNLDNAGGSFSNDGTLRMQGGETLMSFTNDTNSGTISYDGTGSYISGLAAGDSYYNILFNGAGGTWALDAALDVNGSLTLTAGTLNVGGSNYQINVGGDWTDTGAGTFTEGSGTVVFDGTGTINANESFYRVTIAGARTLGAALSLNDSLTISSGDLDVSASNYQITIGNDWIDTGAGTFTERSGTVVFNGPTSINSNEAFNNVSILSSTFLESSLEVNGALTVGNGATLDIDGYDLDLTGGTFSNDGTLKIQGGETLTSFTNDTNSGTVEYDGTGSYLTALTGGNNYYNLMFSGIGGVWEPNGAVDVNGALTVATGATFDLDGQNLDNAGGTFSNDGTLRMQGGETLTNFTNDTNSGTISYDGTGSYLTSLVAGNNYYSLSFVGNGGTWEPNGAVDVNGTLTVATGATFDLDGQNLDNTGGSFSNDGTLRMQGGETLTNFTNDTNSGTISYDGTGSYLTSLIAGNNYYSLSFVGNGGTWEPNGAVDVNGALTVATGATFDIDGQNLDLTGGSFSNDGTLRMQGGETLTNFTNDTNSGAISYDGTGSYLTSLAAGNAYHDLAFFGNGGVWEPNGAVDVNGALALALGATFDLDGQNLDLTGGTFTNGGTLRMMGSETLTNFINSVGSGTIQYDGTGSYLTSLSAGNSYYNLTFSGNGGTWEPNGSVDVNGALTVASGAIFDIDGQNLDLTGATFSNDGTVRMQGGETLTNFTNDTNSGTISYDGGGTYASLIAGNNYYGFNISGSGSFTAAAATDVNGIFSQSAGTFVAPATNLTVAGNITRTGGTFTHNSGTVTLDGTSDQAVTAGGAAFNDFTVNNTGAAGSDDITFTGDLDVDGDFLLTDGNFHAPALMYTALNFTQTGGTFTHNNGRLTFDSVATTVVDVGTSIDFYDLYVAATAGKLVQFTGGQTFNILAANTFNVGNNTTLESTNATRWNLSVNNAATAGVAWGTNVSIADANNISVNPISAVGVINGGNNAGIWDFTGNNGGGGGGGTVDPGSIDFEEANEEIGTVTETESNIGETNEQNNPVEETGSESETENPESSNGQGNNEGNVGGGLPGEENENKGGGGFWDFGGGNQKGEKKSQKVSYVFVHEGAVDVNSTLVFPGESIGFGADGKAHHRTRAVYVVSAAGVQVVRRNTRTAHKSLKDYQFAEQPAGIAAGKNNSQVYLVLPKSGKVAVLDNTQMRVSRNIYGLEQGSREIAISPDDKQAYVVNPMTDTVTIVNLRDQKIIKTVPTGNMPSKVVVSPDGRYLFITNRLDGTVSKIHATTGKMTATFEAGKSPYGIAMSEDGSKIYVTDPESDAVMIFEENADKTSYVMAKKIEVGKAPHAITYDPIGKKIFVANRNSESVTMIDAITQEVLAEITVGKRPADIEVTPEGDTAYVANELSGSVSYVDLGQKKVLENIPTGDAPRELALSNPPKPNRRSSTIKPTPQV